MESPQHTPRESTAPRAEPSRIPDAQILGIAGEALSEFSGRAWTVEPGPLLRGPGTTAVRLGPPHVDSFRHVDLEFLLDAQQPAGTSLIDCATGLDADPVTAIRQAVGSWIDTTASVALELLERQGRFAGHFPPDSPEGFPGWHTIIGGSAGWGFDGGARLKQEWFARTCPWTTLAPVIAPGLDRDALNGIRMFVGQGGDYLSCEVSINGRLHEPSSRALAELDWPRTEKMSTARIFLLLAGRESADG